MLNNPARKPSATANPARITGDAETSVSDMARGDPAAPRNSAEYAPLTDCQAALRYSPGSLRRMRHNSGSVITRISAPMMSAVTTARIGTRMA